MPKAINIGLCSLLLPLAALTYSCQKTDSGEAPITRVAATSAATDWAATLAAAQPFRAFVMVSETFLSADDAYYHGLSEAGKAARRAALQAAYDNGTECPDPYQTASQVAVLRAAQRAAAAELKAKYPAFFQLPENEQMAAQNTALAAVLQEIAPTLADKSCHAGYIAAAFSCYEQGSVAAEDAASRAFYNGCRGYVAAAQ